MQQKLSSPREITQSLLDKSGQAFLTGDFDAFFDCIALPYELETFSGKRHITTPEQMRQLFHAVRSHHQKTNVTDMARHVVEAGYKDEDTVVATFETRLLNGTTLTQEPYPVFAVINRLGDHWRAQSMTFAIEDSPDHNALLLSVGDN